MAKEQKRKRQTFTHEQKQRLEELEGRLFGTAAKTVSEFGTEEARNAERLPQTAQQDAALDNDDSFIVWEDRRPGGANIAESSDDEAAEDDHEDSSDDAEDGKAKESDSDEAHSEAEESGPEESDEETIGAVGEELEAERDNGALESDDEALAMPSNERQASGGEAKAQRQPVWEDEDEDALQVDISAVNRLRKLRTAESDATISGREYSKRLKQQHAKLNPRTSWASLGTTRAEDASEDELEEASNLERLRQGASNLLTGNAVLPATLLEVTRVKDANREEPCQATVQSVEFHPGGQLLMTAALDKRLRFFQVDGVNNAKVQSVYLADLPVHKAAFASAGSKVVATGRRKHFYMLDLEAAKIERVSYLAGRLEKSRENFAVSPEPGSPLIAFLGARGYISLVSWRSRQPVASLKMPASVRSVTFTDDGSSLLASGGDGIVHTWDLRTRQCISRFVDEGALKGIALASSPGQEWLATGADAGFVNIYKQKAAVEAGFTDLTAPAKAAVVKPLRSLKNLTTAVDNLAFSPDGQILVMSSKMKRDALRLVHTSTMSVFQNWPTSRSPLGFVHSTAFSPHGGFLAVGNAKGKVLLYRLHHYSQI